MKLVYSIASCFAGDGLGVIAQRTLTGIHAAGALGRVFASRHVPSAMDAVVTDALPHPLHYLEDRATKAAYRLGLFAPAHLAHAVLHDQVVARRLGDETAFFGWQGHSLASLRAARRRGMLTMLECCNSHVDNVQEVLSAERARHGLGASELRPWVERLRAEYALADVLCCPSHYVAESFAARGVERERLLLAPYGVDLERFRPRPRSDAVFRVVFAGDDMLRKGAHVLLAAWRELDLGDAELVLCGAVYPQVRPILERLRAPGVRLAGRVRSMEDVYAGADLCVLPTFEDGFGLVILEAMACGLPVIATTRSGGPDVITEGVDGFVVAPGDRETLKRRIAALHADRDRLRGMAAAARTAAERHPWSRRSATVLERLQAGAAHPIGRDVA